MPEDWELAEELFVSESVMHETAPNDGVLGIGDIVRFLSGRTAALAPTSAHQRYLFSKPGLRVAYQRLKQRLVVAELPTVAAASVGALTNRRFPGGRISISRWKDTDQMRLFVELEERIEVRHVDLVLEHPDKGPYKLSFSTSPNEDGQFQEFLDMNDPTIKTIIELLQDPTASGAFVLGG